MIIGICGKSGCGKSTLANQIIKLTNNKAIHLDIDKIGHRVLLLPEVQKELISSFGESVVKENNVDIKILLDIPYEIRKQRAMKRDNISEEAFDLREKASIEFDESAFDYVLKTNDKEIVKRLVNSL